MGLGARKPLLLNPDLIARAKTLIRWGALTLALSHARERESGPLSRRERAGVRGAIVQLSAINPNFYLSSRFKILPVAVFGNVSRISTLRGYL